MEKYRNQSGKSGVIGYIIKEKSIQVFFKDGSKYLYTYKSAGKRIIEIMKELAKFGIGLNRYINKAVKTKYASKTRGPKKPKKTSSRTKKSKVQQPKKSNR